MKLTHMAVLSLVVMANPAFALKVTNLDRVVHTVELSGAGVAQKRVIQPNATEFFTGASHGRLSLVTPNATKGIAASAKTQESTVAADGLLSGVIGIARTRNIPADPDSSYVIWPGGSLNVQSRTKETRGR